MRAMSEQQPQPIAALDVILFLFVIFAVGGGLDKSDFAGTSAAAGGMFVAGAVALGCLSISRSIRARSRP